MPFLRFHLALLSDDLDFAMPSSVNVMSPMEPEILMCESYFAMQSFVSVVRNMSAGLKMRKKIGIWEVGLGGFSSCRAIFPPRWREGPFA